ncbi:hypothetical protein [Qipengyuania nanhaisediminis]|uniref:hypothetical protein n=1 Tax=Qipengyuania nanhaisediminis TaxID=604088 RepID=UPI0038B34486
MTTPRADRTGPSLIGRIARNLALWLLVGAVLFIAWQRDLLRVPQAIIDPASQAAFEQWIDEDEERRIAFQQFEGLLRQNGVADVVPAWQLARIDRFYADRCDLPVWRLPPRELWPNIVPALELVRDHVKPAMGDVAVQSSWRTPELNECARGAARSRHLGFEALDLRLVTPRADLEGLYRELCAMHAEAGPQSRMGLGAYYKPGETGFNRGGRFHIDAAGYRSWGPSYRASSSPCR